jgi:hypothetical protein
MVWATLMKCGCEPMFWKFVMFVCIVVVAILSCDVYPE